MITYKSFHHITKLKDIINKLTNTYLNGNSSFANMQINYMITEIKEVTKPIISSAAVFFLHRANARLLKNDHFI